jgi:uncharacterized protein YdhG (YjbR/CyaY superfamily)
MAMKQYKSMDEYIGTHPKEVQEILQKIRQTIKTVIPDAQETIGYGIPTFKLKGNVVHFAAYKNHIGFYPAPSGIEAFSEELSEYKTGKGTLQFPLDKPIPYSLIKKVTEYRAKETLAKKKK